MNKTLHLIEIYNNDIFWFYVDNIDNDYKNYNITKILYYC